MRPTDVGPSAPPVYGGADRVDSPNPQTGSGNTFLDDQLANLGIDPSIGSSGGSIGDNSPVFTGWTRSRSTYGAPIAQTRSIAEIMHDVYNWDRDKIAAVGQKFVNAGWLQPGDEDNLAAVAQQYQKLLELAAAKTGAGSMVTPDELLAGWVGGNSKSRPGSYTNSVTLPDLTNPVAARQLLRQTLQDTLGRDPSAAEQQGFLAALHQAEREDPTVRTSTYKLDPVTGQYGESLSSTKEGVDASAYAADYGNTHNTKEAGAYQAAATFFPALMQAIGATV